MTAADGKLLLCRQGHRRFALPVTAVERVWPAGAVAPVAGVRDAVTVQGERVALLDLPRHFGDVGHREAAPDDVFVVMHHAGRRAGFFVDALDDLVDGDEPAHSVPWRAIEPLFMGLPASEAPAQRSQARPGPTLEVVVFDIGPHRCAIETPFVSEVRRVGEITPLPCTPPFVSGIMNVHGRIVAVIDLKRFLELGESGWTDPDEVVIVQHADVEFAILADRIVGTSRVPLDSLQPAPSLSLGPRAACVRGTAPGPLVVLDGARLLAEPALVVDEEVAP
ncbi:MAG: chemotaxis protein CheW [Rhizobacter sp.]